MLRDFGLVTVIDLTVALLGVLVVLPAVLCWPSAGRRARAAAPARAPGEARAATAGSSRSPTVALIVYVSLNTLRSDGVSSEGLKAGSRAARRSPRRWRSREARRRRQRGAQGHGQGSAGDRPACSVRGHGILNSCQLGERGPFVLAFMAHPRGAQCTRELDALERARGALSRTCSSPPSRSRRQPRRPAGARAPAAAGASPIGLGPRRHPRQPVRGRRLPAADLRAAEAGRARAPAYGELDRSELDARLQSLERAARAKGWRP